MLLIGRFLQDNTESSSKFTSLEGQTLQENFNGTSIHNQIIIKYRRVLVPSQYCG